MTTAPVPAHPTPPAPIDGATDPFVPAPAPAPLPPHTISVWQKPEVINMVSFATSLALHLAIVIVGVLFIKTVPNILQPPTEQVIIPDAAIVENAPIGGVPNPGLGGDPDRAAAQDQI